MDSVKEKAEHMVKVKFPSKIVELNALLETTDFNGGDCSKYYQEINIPVPDAEAISRFVSY